MSSLEIQALEKGGKLDLLKLNAIGTADLTCEDGKVVVPEGIEVILLDEEHPLPTNTIELILPDSLIIIGERVCQNLQIKKIVIPANVVYIGGKAFAYCKSLISGKFSQNSDKAKALIVAEEAFFSSGLERVAVCREDVVLGKRSFAQSPVECFEFKGKILKTENFVFGGTRLRKVKLSGDVTLGAGVFPDGISQLDMSNCSKISVIDDRGLVKIVKQYQSKDEAPDFLQTLLGSTFNPRHEEKEEPKVIFPDVVCQYHTVTDTQWIYSNRTPNK
jgi:hypothetical protein